LEVSLLSLVLNSHCGFDPRPVPSAAFLEEQLRKQQAEKRTAPQPPPKMSKFPPRTFFFFFFFSLVRYVLMQRINLVDVSDYVYPEETKLREVAKRTGATVTTRECPFTKN